MGSLVEVEYTLIFHHLTRVKYPHTLSYTCIKMIREI